MNEALKLAFPASCFKSNLYLCSRNKKGEWKEGFAVVPSDKIYDYLDTIKINPKIDYYITANPLKNQKRVKRTTENQFSFKNIVLDIDIHGNLDEWDKLWELCELKNTIELAKDLPKPNIINWTGRGLQLWYCLYEINIDFKMQWYAVVSELLARIEKLIISNPELYDCNIDKTASKNAIGVYRLFDTYNTKTNTKGEAEIIHSNRYDLKKLYDDLVPENKKNKKKEKLIEIESDYLPLFRKRKRFIEWIVDNRKRDLKGSRDLILFQYVNACYGFLKKEQAQAEAKALNEIFLNPLPIAELEKIFRYTDEKGAFDRMTVEGFLEFLNCSQAEIEHYKRMRTVEPHYTRDQERKAEKMKREQVENKVIKMRKNGTMIKDIAAAAGISERSVKSILSDNNILNKDLKQARDERIIELKNKGLTVAEITKLAGVSRETYYRVLRNYREAGTA